jgi:hypothetical protein
MELDLNRGFIGLIRTEIKIPTISSKYLNNTIEISCVVSNMKYGDGQKEPVHNTGKGKVVPVFIF